MRRQKGEEKSSLDERTGVSAFREQKTREKGCDRASPEHRGAVVNIRREITQNKRETRSDFSSRAAGQIKMRAGKKN